jgi:hypothetical protein
MPAAEFDDDELRWWVGCFLAFLSERADDGLALLWWCWWAFLFEIENFKLWFMYSVLVLAVVVDVVFMLSFGK